MAKRNVEPGNPPLIWSNIELAFRNVNANFEELYATLQDSSGIEVVDFSNLFTDVSPNVNDEYSLGAENQRWKSLYVSPFVDSTEGENNGIHLGNALIKGVNDTVDLPANATVDGNLIINPDNTFFKSFQIDSDNRIVADEFVDTINLLSGTAMRISVDSVSESITFDNIGVTELNSGSGINVSSQTGNITLTNTGVLSITNSSSLAASSPYSVGASGRAPGIGIAVDTATGNPTLTNTGVIEVQGGFGITVSTDAGTGIATIQNSSPAQPAFGRIRLSDDPFGINDVVAETTTDQLTLDAGYGIILTNTPASDTLKIELDQKIDINGNVYADDSTILVNGLEGNIPANNLIGTATIDLVGNTTGYHTGDVTGSIFADDSKRVVNGTDGSVTANSLNITTVDTVQNAWFLSYNSSTGEVTKFSSDAAAFIAPTLQSSGLPSDTLLSGTLLAQGNDINSPNLVNATGDLIGSVFSDDSSMIIDGVNGNVVYTATTPSDWDGDAPTTVGEAIDRLATLVKTLNGGTGA